MWSVQWTDTTCWYYYAGTPDVQAMSDVSSSMCPMHIVIERERERIKSQLVGILNLSKTNDNA